MTQIRVLYVDSDSGTAKGVSTALEREDGRLDVFTESDPDAMLACLADADIECVVVTADRFETGVTEFVTAVRDVDSLVPFMVVASEWDTDAAHRAIRAEAADYVVVEGDAVAVLARRIVAAVANYRDQRALTPTERPIDTERTRFQTLFEHAWDAIAFTEYINEVPIVRDINPAFEAMFGYSHDEVVGRSLNELIVPQDHREQAIQIDRETSAGRWTEQEVRRRTADGELRDFLFRGIQLTTPTGNIEGYPIYTDITERKERQRELERQNERLDEFATFVSHDLRNPLNVAQGRLAFAAEECESEHLPYVADALDRMASIIEDTLTLARYGEPVDELETIRVARMLGQCWSLVDTRDAKLDVTDDFALRGDPGQLRHLFENLFRNAVEHAGNAVTVSVGLLDGGAGFYVEDDGVGIPESERDRVFEPGRTTGGNGTGLGLTIVKRIAEVHDWTVTVTESIDGGARFEFAGVSLVA